MYVYCFECGPKRYKQNTKTLRIKACGAYCSLICYHPGCLYNEIQYMKKNQLEKLIGKITIHTSIPTEFLIPIDESINRPELMKDEIDYDYRDIDGKLLWILRRFPDKEFLPIAMNTNKEWVCKRPLIKCLYYAQFLRDDMYSPLLVVEGEKAAEYVRNNTIVDVVSWPGGAQNVRQGDWDLIKGRKVFLWPDNDDPGIFAMIEVEKYLEQNNVVKWLPTGHLPFKSDAADCTVEQINEILEQAGVFSE